MFEMKALHNSLNFIRLLRVVITPSVTTLLRGENDSKQSDEFQASSTIEIPIYIMWAIQVMAWPKLDMSDLTLDLPPAAAGGRSGGYDNVNN